MCATFIMYTLPVYVAVDVVFPLHFRPQEHPADNPQNNRDVFSSFNYSLPHAWPQIHILDAMILLHLLPEEDPAQQLEYQTAEDHECKETYSTKINPIPSQFPPSNIHNSCLPPICAQPLRPRFTLGKESQPTQPKRTNRTLKLLLLLNRARRLAHLDLLLLSKLRIALFLLRCLCLCIEISTILFALLALPPLLNCTCDLPL